MKIDELSREQITDIKIYHLDFYLMQSEDRNITADEIKSINDILPDEFIFGFYRHREFIRV